MSRRAYDGIGADWQKIAAVAKPGELVFGYADGPYSAWPAVAWDHFTQAGIETVEITVTGNPECGIYDGFPDNGTGPADWRAYVRGRRTLGHVATIYVDMACLPHLRAGCQGLDYRVIVADWTGVPHEIPGCAGTQWFSGPDYDMSEIYDAAWHPAG